MVSKSLFLALLTFSSLAFGRGLDLAPVCRTQVTQKIPKAEFQKAWWSFRDADGLRGSRRFDFKRGEEFKYHLSASNVSLSITDVSKGTTTSYTWQSPACKESVRTSSAIRKPAQAADFDDKTLTEVVKAHSWGVVYVWSPYMPLSYMGLKEIREAVKAKNGHLTVVMDPRSAPEEVKPLIQRYKLTSHDQRTFSSGELRYRAFGVHYPAAIVYSKGSMADTAYLGHKRQGAYERWIDYEIAQLQEKTR